MSLHTQIKELNTSALKAGNKVARSAYTLILGELARQGDPNQVVDDATVVKTVQKAIVGINEILALGRSSEETVELITGQREVLQALVPTQAGVPEITVVVSKLLAENPSYTQKDMGKVMSAVKEHFGASHNGGAASQVVKAMLANHVVTV